SKVLRVVGLSSAVLYDKENPFNPINRRISIIVMNKKADDAASRECARAVNVVSGDEDGAELTTGPSYLTGSPAPAPSRSP
ncbi:hypothetical protein, partial [Mucilaginibacter sp. 10I4]|uniref:hypothetical protein n=1 Tax=Mucilaginibacter sp. 10I4 TaxID=3048580 RepID=UPI002B22E57B